MLDAFEILTTSGIVLWRKHYTPVSPNAINSLISDVFIEERGQATTSDGSGASSYKKERYTLKWTNAKDVGLVFVAVYQSLLHLSWVDNLLTAVKALFTKEYGVELQRSNVTKLDCTKFDQTFDLLVRKLDTGSLRQPSEPDSDAPGELTPPSSSASNNEDAIDEAPPPPVPVPQFKKPTIHRSISQSNTFDDTTSTDVTPVPTPDTSRPSTPSGHLLAAKAGPAKASRRTRKAQAAAFTSGPVSSGDESTGSARRQKIAPKSAKSKRRWDATGGLVEDGDADESTLDYSATTDGESVADLASPEVANVRAEDMGSRTGKGQFLLKDLDDEVEAILASSKKEQAQNRKQLVDLEPESTSGGLLGTAGSKISGLFRNVVGGKKLSKQDLQQPLQAMQNHLLEKNVAREAAVQLTQTVERDLLDSTTGNFTSVDRTIRESMSRALTRILTPTTSLDLLRSITSTIEGPTARPYVISIVGVNGVGKSTSLGKIAYFLLQNNFRVLVVAGDTFRSGAVEQLRVHVRNLSELAKRENVGTISLFEKGYGKDAGQVARDAIASATPSPGKLDYDVVLIDTAAKPDKIFMVGEALVGTDAVAQARNFSKEFVDEKGVMRNGGRGMDGFIVSKCDTVGDMVGVLVSMVFATGIPVVFLGVGQHYGDLRGLNVGWAVDKLMK